MSPVSERFALPFADRKDPHISSEISHFRSITLAVPTIDDAAFHPVSASRHLTDNGLGHSLMAGTFNTPETLAHLLTFFRPPSREASNLETFSTTDVNDAEVKRFYTFGTGLNAHAGLLHGGVMACILDSSMSNAAGLTMRAVLGPADTVFTVQLNVKYEKPVKTPGSVMIRAWVSKVEGGGRKVWVKAEVSSGGNGEIYHAKAEGLWLRAKSGKL